ncbi:TPA: hypothetical protein ACQKYU_002639, partial [Staphylococcus aureus]
MPQSCCICVVALSTINDYFLHQSKNRTDINKYKAYLSIRFSYKTKRGWDIKFLGNVKKLISINYLMEISFFD